MTRTHVNPTPYRPDIDGIRAIAVLSVVFFHVSHSWLPNGYLGVDIFFVISGFLITRIIWRECLTEGFSIAKFYERRIRRIAPALLAVLVASVLAALAIFLPYDLVNFGKSVLATIFFVANIYFWRDTNYFSPDADQKPLLHMWSLSIEEQFYIIFPILLILIARYIKNLAFWITVLLTIGSLGLAILLNQVGGQSPSFFLLPTRAWQLGAGACLALANFKPVSGIWSQILSALSLIGLCVVMVIPTNKYAVLPPGFGATIATVALLYFGQTTGTLSQRLLSIKPMVWIGLISYSLYLWHWPVLVFAKYYLVRPLTPSEMVVAIVVMFVLASVSWKYIEQPFRKKSLVRNKVYAILGSVALIVGLSATSLIVFKGFPSRFSGSAAVINSATGTHYRCPVSEFLAFGSGRGCELNLDSRDPADADIVLFGNSHAQMYAPLWKSLFEEKELHGLLVPMNLCLPTVSVNYSIECMNNAHKNIEAILALENVKTVIIAFTWENDKFPLINEAGERVDYSRFIQELDALIRTFQSSGQLSGQSSGKNVILIGPISYPGWDLASQLSRRLAANIPNDNPLSESRQIFNQKYEQSIAHFSARKDIAFIRPDRITCDAQECYFILDERSLFADSNHLAQAELYRFETIFREALTHLNIGQ